ncbi:MAG: T9SS type A sorting domain-containing protein [Desulfobulbaceae bacterium]|nr:T9SS type A sorting domain-containing protein [Candidatus Kapabacteria bacterium]MBS4000211.1 T9SS type A sorting domain-containing protein [Desulfobulbaceae bacterium]
MKKYLLLLALLIALPLDYVHAKDKDDDELLRKSQLGEPIPFNSGMTSFPRNFSETTQQNNPTQAAVSTGYYWIDDAESLNPILFPGMRPNPTVVDTNYQPELWRKIVAGPRMLPKAYWQNNKQEGLPFFRQPADADFWDNPTDSTDEAIAGPIPLGIKGGFFFNGLRYDSFYVSTNGVIALTNRRYIYDPNGNRVIPPGATSCYDPMSMDWYAGGVRGRDTLWVRNWLNTQDSINPTSGLRIPNRDGLGNIQYKNGLNDPAPDNFGYQFSVLGMDPTNPQGFNPSNTLGGIRARGGDVMTAINANSKTALIAVFWGDMMLSQFEPESKTRDEHGMAFYKRTYTNDSLIIAFYNAQPKGALAGPFGGVTMPADVRPTTTNNYVTVDAHVVLSSVDSSITVHFTRLSDGWNSTYRKTPAREVIRYNTTCGVRGFARHVNFGKGGILDGSPWAGEYIQGTTWFQRYASNSPAVLYPGTGNTVKFKQWQNTIRVADIQYRIRSLDPKVEEADKLKFTQVIPSTLVNDYEMLAGHERLGAIQPIALIQNLTNEIQGPSGVNFVKQDLKFRARFQLRNVITNRVIYNRLVPIDELCLGLTDENSEECMGDPSVRVRLGQTVTVSSGNYNFTPVANFKATGFNGVPPYYFVQVQFPPFEANEFIDNHIGKLRAYIIAESVDPKSGEKLRDNWPFDDSSKVNLFVMRRYYDEHPDPLYRNFEDDGRQFHVDTETGDVIPSAWKWVNINAQMVSGDIVSKYPLPPRGAYIAANYPIGISSPRTLLSPVIKMNRVQMDGFSEPLPAYMDKRTPPRGGDEIRSFPIDLRGKPNPVLTLSVQRATFEEDRPRGFSDEILIGPEPRVYQNPNPLNPYLTAAAGSAVPDELVVEFAKPTSDGINRITNIKLEDWRHHPYRRGTKDAALTNMAALTVFGGGGHLIGFLETFKDSTLALPGAATSGVFNSLRHDPYDDGFDWEYKKFAIAIPDTFVLWENDGSKYFRFRIKVFATNDKKCLLCIEDDTDDFYVDNIKILYRAEVTDIEVNSVKVNWPYTLVPASQATNVPISVRVSNNTDIDAPGFSVKVKIFRANQLGEKIEFDPIYCRTQNISNLVRRGTSDVNMPAWNARQSQTDTIGFYVLEAMIVMSERDLVIENDSTYSNFTLRFGRYFAYDPPVAQATNSVPGTVPTIGGKGLNFLVPLNPAGTSRTGPAYDRILDGTGAVGGSGSGAIAMKFNLLNSDTLRGFSIYWAGLNRAADQVTFTLYEGGERLPNTNNELLRATTTRGGPGFQNIYERYVDYYFNSPIVLEKGVYWIGISQDGQTGMELGASASRMGMRTMATFVSLQGIWGESGITLSIDKNFRRVIQGKLQNDNFFAFQNVAGSLSWIEFTPASGNPAFAHVNHWGTNPIDGTTQSLSNGSWIPMLRPYFGPKSHGYSANVFQWCPDDIPVELVSFNGKVRESGIDLFWETASEENNYGFYVERRINDNDEFDQIGFVEGVGNSSIINRYNYQDNNVTIGSTYQYRLRQMDRDGSQACTYSQIVTLTYDRIGALVLEQNSPNPFANQTLLKFNLPSTQNVKLEVIDIFGNVVRTLENGVVSAGPQTYTFDAIDANGTPLSNGSYIYRLTAENEVLSGKMTVIR